MAVKAKIKIYANFVCKKVLFFSYTIIDGIEIKTSRKIVYANYKSSSFKQNVSNYLDFWLHSIRSKSTPQHKLYNKI